MQNVENTLETWATELDNDLSKASKAVKKEHTLRMGALTTKLNGVMIDIDTAKDQFEEIVKKHWANYCALQRQVEPTKQVRHHTILCYLVLILGFL